MINEEKMFDTGCHNFTARDKLDKLPQIFTWDDNTYL